MTSQEPSPSIRKVVVRCLFTNWECRGDIIAPAGEVIIPIPNATCTALKDCARSLGNLVMFNLSLAGSYYTMKAPPYVMENGSSADCSAAFLVYKDAVWYVVDFMHGSMQYDVTNQLHLSTP